MKTFHKIAFLMVFCFCAFSLTAGVPVSNRQILSTDFNPGSVDKIKIAFFDADSTLRVAPSGKFYPITTTDVALLPLSINPMKQLMAQGYLIAVVTNQAEIASGKVTMQTANSAVALTVSMLAKHGVAVHYYDFADKMDNNHKPNTGMAERLANLIKTTYKKPIDWSKCIMVGDSGYTQSETQPDGKAGTDPSDADRLFAQNVSKEFGGCQYFHPRDYFGWIKYDISNFDSYAAMKAFLTDHPELDLNSANSNSVENSTAGQKPDPSSVQKPPSAPESSHAGNHQGSHLTPASNPAPGPNPSPNPPSAPILRVTVLDVGQGDSILLRSAEKTVLIDAGDDKMNSAQAIADYLKKAGITKIDTAVITHPHRDHFGGYMQLVEMFPIGEFIYSIDNIAAVEPGAPAGDVALMDQLKKEIATKKIPYHQAKFSDTFNWGGKLQVQLLNDAEGETTTTPQDPSLPGPNDFSLVFKVTAGNVSYLFTGDAQAAEEVEMIQKFGSQLKCNFLKVGHHGSDTSTSQPFLDKVKPDYAAISCGVHNEFHHPRPGTLQKLQTMGIKIYRTDLNSTIESSTDGKTISVTTSKAATQSQEATASN
ncbi:MAG: HAD-IIIA family hydrolase [Candidatus Riflebacteria bacterium]|nr:HAD-IIIA family hydrolase [Candidatus Riflebacteria bacterium]